jgi:putative membrane protein
MHFINEQDKQRISDAIQEVETKTSGELVTVIAQSSDDYQYIPVLWAALLALVVPGPMVFFSVNWFIDSIYFYQLIIFVVAALVCRLPVLRLRLIPRYVRQRRAHRHAMEQFVLNDLPATEQDNGILLFVSVAEHYVEIIADKGINERVEAGAWDQIVSDFTKQVKQGAIADGFVTAINECGKILQQHFPSDNANKNDLPNHLIMV